MILALNEWIFHDLLHENGADAFRETAQFLDSLRHSNDRLIVPAESRWREKAFQLMRATDVLGREVSKLLHSLLRNSDRAIWIQADDTQPFVYDVPDQTPDEDIYLVLAYRAGNADVLVTTDHGLFTALAENDGVSCRLRDDFLADYSGSCPR